MAQTELLKTFATAKLAPIGKLDHFGFFSQICVRYTSFGWDVYIRFSRHRLLCVLETTKSMKTFLYTWLDTRAFSIASPTYICCSTGEVSAYGSQKALEVLQLSQHAENTDHQSDALRLRFSRLSVISNPARRQEEEGYATTASGSRVVVRSRPETRPA